MTTLPEDLLAKRQVGELLADIAAGLSFRLPLLKRPRTAAHTAPSPDREVRRLQRTAFQSGGMAHRHQQAATAALRRRQTAIHRLSAIGLTANEIAQLLHASITDIAGVLNSAADHHH